MTYVEPAKIPVVDFTSLKSEDPEERKAALKLLDEAFQACGFVYISNHGIPQKLVEEAFDWSKRFFDLPHDTKMLVAHPSSGDLDDHRGFTEVGQAHVSQLVFDHNEVQRLRKIYPERKEALEMGPPYSNVGDDVPANRWLPEDVFPGHEAFVRRWWDACTKFNHALLATCSEVLQLPSEDYLSQRQSRNICHMSWAFYPQMPVGPLQDQSLRRLNAHTDFGQLTVLFQDDVGGLEVHDGQIFRPVIPRPGTVVINVGDLLERQTNGRWKSALHQVVAPREMMGPVQNKLSAGSVVDRYALVYFGTPDPDSVVEVLPGHESMGKWKPNIKTDGNETITAAQWIQKRLEFEY